jgi:hypothetical protein
MEKIRIDKYADNARNPLFACWGCELLTGWTAAGGFECPRYADPQKLYAIRVFGICPHNQPKEETKKGRVRVGQQKQKRNRR